MNDLLMINPSVPDLRKFHFCENTLPADPQQKANQSTNQKNKHALAQAHQRMSLMFSSIASGERIFI